jgi:hypothetical protein
MVLHVINTSNCDAHRSIIPPEEFKDPILTSEQLVKEFEIMRFPSYWLEDKHSELPSWEPTKTRLAQ